MRTLAFLVTLILLIGIAACVDTVPNGTEDSDDELVPDSTDGDDSDESADDPDSGLDDDPADEPSEPGDGGSDGSASDLPLGEFAASYYDGENFDELVGTGTVRAIDFEWADAAPLEGMDGNTFSARWEGRFEFDENEYVFTATTDDGMRVWLDGELIMDEWDEQHETFTETVSVEAGIHEIRVEYFEREWGATAKLDWSLAGTDARPDPIIDPVPGDDTSGDAPPPPDGSRRITYQADTTTDFANPERGWYTEKEGNTWGIEALRDPVRSHADYMPTLNMRYVRLDDYRNQDLPQWFLDDLKAEFESWRGSGVKAVLRFAYNRCRYCDDASLEQIKRHILQLEEEIFYEYQDVIAVLQGGFVGQYGEQTRSDITTDPQARQEFVEFLLAHTPPDMMVQFRYPYLMMEVHSDPLTDGERFTGSEQARMGIYNDCLGAGYLMCGTFEVIYDKDKRPEFDRESEYAYLSEVGPFTGVGGETCACNYQSSHSEGSNIIEVMEDWGFDYLNHEFYEAVLNDWDDSGHLAEISRRLGYRLVLEEAIIPEDASPGETVSVSFTMRNDGFGKVYNPRPIDLVLDGPIERTVRLDSDARRELPLGGEERTLTYEFTVPADLPSGDYGLELALPDPSPYLDEPSYAIRLANVGMWNAADGTNDLNANIIVG